jgi:hypothetical protein
MSQGLIVVPRSLRMFQRECRSNKPASAGGFRQHLENRGRVNALCVIFRRLLQRCFLGKFGETVAAHAMRRMLDAIYGSRNRAVDSRVFIGRHCVGEPVKACNAGTTVGLDSDVVEVLHGVLCAHGLRTSRVAE